jgi:hypothetical protein
VYAKILKEYAGVIPREEKILNDLNIFYMEYITRLCKIIDKLFDFVIIEGVDEAPNEEFRIKIY